MKERINKLRESLKEFWTKMTKRQKLAIGLGGGAIAVAVLALLIFSGVRLASPQMTTLYNNLSPEDANAIVTELKKGNIKYELASNGTQILVNPKNVAEKRIEFASKGLPTSGTAGYELFDATKLGLTDFTQKVNLRRAIEGELTRTIQGLEQVEKARVMVVMPEASPFVTEQKNPTASVALSLKPKAELNEDQVRGIMNMVSASIEGMKPEDVTIVDSSGNLISDIQKKKDERDRLQMSQLQLKQKIEIEERYEKKIREYLGKVFGGENIVVAVTAELDFDKRNREDEVYEPVVGDKGVVRSEQEISEKYLGTGTVPEIGVPGTTSNIPGYKGLAEGNAQYSREEATRNYEITRRLTKQEDNQGDIARLQVAVIINEDIKYQGNEPYIRGNRRVELQDNISKAANIDPTRGDAINLTVMKFKIDPTKDLGDAFRQQEKMKRIMKYASLALLLLAVIAIFVLSWIALRNAVVPEEVEEEEETYEEEMVEPVPVEELLVPELSDEQRLREKIKEEVLRMVHDDPEGAALIVRSWLFEE